MNREQLMIQWDIMEALQEEQPHFHIGWYGFAPMYILTDKW